MKLRNFFALFLSLVLLMGLNGCAPGANSSSALITVKLKKTQELNTRAAAYWSESKKPQQIGEPVSVVEYAAPFSYGLQYPKTGYQSVDDMIAQAVAERRAAFDKKYLLPENLPESGKPSADTALFLRYETYLTEDGNLSLVLFEREEPADAAPVTQLYILHYDLAAGTAQKPEDLMWERFRENASAYTQKYFLETEPYKKGLFGDYKKTLASDSSTFDRFALTDDGVLFYFEPYQLFPGSYGLVRLIIPYEDMRAKAAPPQAAPDIAGFDAEKPMVALTFDDGPNPRNTGAILDTLEQYNAVATFFDLGSLVERYPAVVQREIALGCEVGSHSYNHKDFKKLSNAEISNDVKAVSRAFQSAIGQEPTLFRPPYGNTNQRVNGQIPMPLVLWSVDTLDWKSRNATSVMAAVKKAGNLDGKVILMHGIYESSAEATAQLVPYLLEEGYQLVTVSQLIEAKYGETPQPSKLYGYDYFQ